jgi:hypothetical protein
LDGVGGIEKEEARCSVNSHTVDAVEPRDVDVGLEEPTGSGACKCTGNTFVTRESGEDTCEDCVGYQSSVMEWGFTGQQSGTYVGVEGERNKQGKKIHGGVVVVWQLCGRRGEN